MLKAYRGEILHFLSDPAQSPVEENSIEGDLTKKSYQYFQDGLLVVENGLVSTLGHAESLLTQLPNSVTITQHCNGLIIPGFIDTHVHYPQTEMIASYGEQLLQWLREYTFPTERRFENFEHAKDIAHFFLEQLLNAGTTTALVFATVHKESVEAFFSVAEQKKLRMICGKVLMDRNCPDYLSDSAESGYFESKKLIDKWHKKQRLQYAVTPRFAPTSSNEQLIKAGQLLTEYPDLYLHTHLSENKKEIEWVKKIFPDNQNYLDVYHQRKLLGRRSVFAHGLHLQDEEYWRLAETNSAIAFCPSSNLFLGSGLFDLTRAKKHQINIGLGTDVGAGTSFSILRTMSDGYKTQQLRGNKLDPFQSFYLATLGGAIALDLQGTIGNFVEGAEADFIFLDYHATEISKKRIQCCKSLAEKLFVLSILGDERHVKATYILGEKHEKKKHE